MLKSGAKVIAVCSAGINSDYNDSLWGAFHSLANLFDLKYYFLIHLVIYILMRSMT